MRRFAPLATTTALDYPPRVEDTRKAAVAEFLGTFALVFFGAGSVILYLNGQLDLVGVALAYGLVMAVMVSQMAHLSGGVFNPAIQLALWVTGRMSTPRTLAYVGAQLAGGVAGGLLLRLLVPAQAFRAALGGTPALGGGISSGKGILLEAVGTFFLVWAVYATIVDGRGPFGKTAGLTIGLTITFGVLAMAPWTGAAFNVARWFGPALASGQWDDWFVWIVGPIAGAILAGVTYWSVFLRDEEPTTP
jgi:MIP family channel proteins